ncbi:MAG: nucleotidyltransferase domain-containing protein [bacterium]
MSDRATEVLNDIRGVLAASGDLLRGHRVVLFGSRAAGCERERSDFDIGVDGEAPLPLTAFYAVADKFESLRTLYRIDWVDLCRTSDGFRAEALKCNRILYHDTQTAS